MTCLAIHVIIGPIHALHERFRRYNFSTLRTPNKSHVYEGVNGIHLPHLRIRKYTKSQAKSRHAKQLYIIPKRRILIMHELLRKYFRQHLNFTVNTKRTGQIRVRHWVTGHLRNIQSFSKVSKPQRQSRDLSSSRVAGLPTRLRSSEWCVAAFLSIHLALLCIQVQVQCTMTSSYLRQERKPRLLPHVYLSKKNKQTQKAYLRPD